MMEALREGRYRLSSGRIIEPNRGIIGIRNPDDSSRWTITSGYDEPITRADRIDDPDDVIASDCGEPHWTKDEVIEIAWHMAVVWSKFAQGLRDD